MKTMKLRTIFGFILGLMMLSASLSAQSELKEFESHRDFMNRTVTADSSEYLARPGNRVHDSAAFEEMRQHILAMYRGVEITHSFVLDSAHYDCIPVDQQPALRNHGIKTIASPPPQSALAAKSASTSATETTIKPALQLDPEKPFDQFGNPVHCEEHTFPMRRITLETMTRFPSLHHFFSKYPDASPQPPGEPAPGAVTDGHKYAITEQKINNLGGNSSLSVWSPYVNTLLGETFSLAQEWYLGGTFGTSGLQSEEVGWIVYPGWYQDEKPHLFIYSTPDGYTGDSNYRCWNSVCGNFHFVPSNVIVGGPLTPSTIGGTQYELNAQYYLYQGNWWLAINGTWIGYYPGSFYRGGQNSKFAQLIQFGTESVGTYPLWPAEGSGVLSNAGYGYAAYQRDLWYYNYDTSGTKVWNSLTARQLSSPSCYTISGPYSSSSSGWARYFYVGGPGGQGC